MTADTLFDRMSALADPVRSRLLLVLERHELTVSELCAVFQLPQSTMSRHLKALHDEEAIYEEIVTDNPQLPSDTGGFIKRRVPMGPQKGAFVTAAAAGS